LEELVDEFGRDISSILLPHQAEAIKGIFVQRSYQQLGLEVFEIPLRLSKELALSSNESRSLATATRDASKSFSEVKKNKESDAWKKIKDASLLVECLCRFWWRQAVRNLSRRQAAF